MRYMGHTKSEEIPGVVIVLRWRLGQHRGERIIVAVPERQWGQTVERLPERQWSGRTVERLPGRQWSGQTVG